MQLKLGLISPQEAATSDMRCVLTRSVGKDPTIQVDYYTVPVNRGDYLLQCSDGMHQCIAPRRSSPRSSRTPRPRRPAGELVALAEKTGHRR